MDRPPDRRRRPVTSEPGSPLIERALLTLRLDLPPEPRQPRRLRLSLAVSVSILGSLVADALLVAVGTALFPSTKGYVHFRFSDYGKLTVVGVVFACVAWPIVTWISSSPRWLFSRLAVLVTLFLLLPDLFILWKGQPTSAVAVLMAMHLAIALVTYNALVHLAPAAPMRQTSDLAGVCSGPTGSQEVHRSCTGTPQRGLRG